MRKVGNFKLAHAGNLLDGKWNNFGSEKIYPGLGDKVLYARTAEDLSNGFFVCVLERCEDGEINEFYTQKQENIQNQKKSGDKNGKRPHENNVESTAENDAQDPPKKLKKKWTNKGYNQ